MSGLVFLVGLVIFLAGIYLVASYIGKLVDKGVRRWLKRFSGNLWLSLLGGVGATAIMQSSSVVSSLGVALAGAGIISVAAGIAVFMGAGIGTTVTAQLVSFPILHYGPWLAGAGAAIWLTLEHRRSVWKITGVILVSLGLIFMGLNLMSQAFAGAGENWLMQYVVSMAKYPWIIFAIGIALTAIMQSSSATIGIILALVMSGVLQAREAIPFILGANIGTTITENIASLVTDYPGKVVGRASFILSLLTAVIVMLILPQFINFVHWVTPDSSLPVRAVANSHTLFNVVSVAVFIPLIPWLERLGRLLVWSKK